MMEIEKQLFAYFLLLPISIFYFSGNITLPGMSPKSLGKNFLCSRHFAPRFLQSKRLPLDAVPDKYQSQDESEEEDFGKENLIFEQSMVRKTYSAPCRSSNQQQDQPSTSKFVFEEALSSESTDEWLTEIQNFPPRSSHKRRLQSVQDENASLKEQLKDSKKRINNLQTQLSHAKKKIMKAQLSQSVSVRNDISQFSKSIINMQLRHKKKASWLPSEKRTALSIYYKGPSTYRYLRRKGLVLPSVSTVRSWVRNFICQPGFNKKIFSRLALKADTMLSSEKKCIILFDEMAIKRNLEYNKKLDIIEGFQDLGKFGRKPVPANQALAVMIRGIYSPWKLPIAYFVSEDGVTANNLKDILTETFRKVKESGFEPVGMTCDLSRRNKQFYDMLGVSVERPYFFLDNQKYYAFFDAPHLLKCVRNNFIAHDFLLNGKFIRFSDIKKVYELDKQSDTGKALIKLTDIHLNPNNFQKMSVKLAAQLLSHSVYAAIKTALRTGQLVSITGENTAFFVKTVDEMFDALNSTRIYSKKPCNRVLSLDNPEVLSALNNAYVLFENVNMVNSKGNLTRPPSFNGILQTINAVKAFATEEREKGQKFLFTGRLIQDPLENQFSVFRQKGGYNRNPTVLSFRSAFKLNIVTNLMRPPKAANSAGSVDEDENVFNTSEDSTLETTLKLFNEEEEESSSSNSSVTSETLNVPTDSFPSATLESCSVVYFAGYLVKKCLDKFKCNDCRVNLQSNEDLSDDQELLNFFKNYNIQNPSALKTPSNLMRQFTFMTMLCYNQYIKKYCTKKIISNIRDKVNEQHSKSLPEWFEAQEKCKEHRKYIVDLLLRTQVFKYCKDISSKIKTRTGTKNVKLSILQHN